MLPWPREYGGEVRTEDFPGWYVCLARTNEFLRASYLETYIHHVCMPVFNMPIKALALRA